jgi:hypothetical protein
MKSEYTVTQVIEWMLEELKRQGKLYEDTVVFEIVEKFGSQFTYEHKNGDLALRKEVLVAFGKLTKDSVVWDQDGRFWQKHMPSDKSGWKRD